MGAVIPLRGARPPKPSAHDTFARARQDMVRAWAEWVREQPSAAAVDEELDGTLAAMDQLRRLEAGDA